MTPGKRSPEPPPVGVMEYDLNRWITNEIASAALEIGVEIEMLNAHSFYDCPVGDRRKQINAAIKTDWSNQNVAVVSIHNNAIGTEWQDRLADTRILYNPRAAVRDHRPLSCAAVSKRLAVYICDELNAMGRKALIVCRSNLAMLRLDCPSVLIECCWMDNKEDLQWIRDNMTQFCQAVARALQ